MMKGRRYLRGVKPAVVHRILRVLPFMSFAKAIDFYLELRKTRDFAGSLAEAFLGANDRFYLLAVILRRHDAFNEWVYDRCREVEADPDDHLDLWSRFHYKSSIITFAGSIQEIIANPEITIGIFSNTTRIAQAFLDQIKRELEENEHLCKLYADVFWADPRKQSPAWSSNGIIVCRKGNPKEATVEAHGVLDALPTSRHYDLLIFDDLVTQESVTTTNTDQIAKTTNRWELAQSLGHGHSRRWHLGTRYSWADTWGVLLERHTLTARIYAATHDGTMNGRPVFLTQEKWDEIKRDQRGVVAAQMLLNPLAGQSNTFFVDHLRPYQIRPRAMTVWIFVDPAGQPSATSDRTAMAVIGLDSAMNRYLLDGVCHRMRLSDRYENLKNLFVKWKRAPGVQMVRVYYERYGMQADIEYIEEKIFEDKIEGFTIEEVSWAREGGQSKNARISRLEPYFRNSQFWLPPKVWHPDVAGQGTATWSIKKRFEPMMAEGEPVRDRKTGAVVMAEVEGSAEIQYQPYTAARRIETIAREKSEHYRIMEPLKRLDQDGNAYDVLRLMFEEYRTHPFAAHDDFIDAMSRIQDVEPVGPMSESVTDLESVKLFTDS